MTPEAEECLEIFLSYRELRRIWEYMEARFTLISMGYPVMRQGGS